MLDTLWFFRRGIARLVLTMALIGAGAWAVSMVVEVPLAPWLRSFGLWPTLTGDWHGEVTAPDGRVSFVYVEIRGNVLNSRGSAPGRSSIHGSLRWCDETRHVHDYEMWGRPENWRGTTFHLSLRDVVERDSGAGLGEIRGNWEGDRILATGALVRHERTVTVSEAREASAVPAVPVVQYALRRGSERDFLTACGARP